MKRFSIILLGIFLPVLLQGQVPSVPTGVTDRYEVRYKMGLVNAKVAWAEMFTEKASWKGEDTYRFSLSLGASSVFKLLVSQEYHATAYFSAEDLSPRFMTAPFVKNGLDSKFEFNYNLERGIIEWEALRGTERTYLEYPLDGRTLDAMSLLFHARFMDPERMKKPETLQLMIVRGAYTVTISYLGVDTDHFSGTKAYHYLMYMPERGVLDNGSGNEIHAWISADQYRTILGLEVPLHPGTMLAKLKR